MVFLLPVVPAGFSGSLEFSVVPPAGGTDSSFLITAPLGTHLSIESGARSDFDRARSPPEPRPTRWRTSVSRFQIRTCRL